MKQNSRTITRIILLSKSSVSCRIDEMAADVDKQLVTKLRAKEFVFQIDKSTLRDNEAVLLAYVRFLDVILFREEILFARLLKTDTKVKQFSRKFLIIFRKIIFHSKI